MLERDHSQVRITELAVLPERRRRRVATELLAQVTEWSLRQHMDQLVFECPTKAQPAISFALFHGFTVCGFQDAYWPGQEVGLFFRKSIVQRVH
jgi:GNAT superfamily N-acetyltransferase